MLSVIQCIKELKKDFPLENLKDFIPKENVKEWYAIVNPNEIIYESFPNDRIPYHIKGIFELGNFYTNFYTENMLVVFTKKKPQKICFGVYEGETYGLRDVVITGKSREIPNSFEKSYLEYISAIENIINKETEINFFNERGNVFFVKEIEQDRLYPRYYTEHANNIKKRLENEAVLKLKDIADIFVPIVCDEELDEEWDEKDAIQFQYKCIHLEDLKYPFSYEGLTLGMKTSYRVEKGDVLFPLIDLNAKPYLFDHIPQEDICVSPFIAIIKCKQVSPEYLYLYLTSDVGKIVRDYLVAGAGKFRKNTIETIAEFPVVVPEFDDEKYQGDFQSLKHIKNRQYELNYHMLEFYDIKKKQNQNNHIKDILNAELARKIKVNNEKQLRCLLEEDINELNICYANKAYKATLILAGSILEAILIDWLSEIHRCNYFREEYYVEKGGKKVRADLIDYINAIDRLKKPAWMEEAKSAHAIRWKRNLVHAKLCLKDDVKINDETCKIVIEDLKKILRSRGIK